MGDPRKEILEELGGDIAEAPIEIHLQGLAATPLDVVPLGACLLRIDEAGPILCEVVERASRSEHLTAQEEVLVFRGLHVLGGSRYAAGFPSLLRLLALGTDELEALLGDVITESLSRIVAGMFDGDAAALFAAICEVERDEFVRDALLGAATFLVWDGQIERTRFEAFLVAFFDERRGPDDDQVWVAWQQAVALLGLGRLRPRVEEAFARGLIPNFVMRLSDFTDDLAAAEQAPADPERFERARLGYIEDVLEELESWPIYEAAEDATPKSPDRRAPDYGPFDRGQPAHNPLRHVGRNDPCPCGSGKKAKKCCLAA